MPQLMKYWILPALLAAPWNMTQGQTDSLKHDQIKEVLIQSAEAPALAGGRLRAVEGMAIYEAAKPNSCALKP